MGLGQSLIESWGQEIYGLHDFPAGKAGDVDIPSTPAALWCWLRGEDRGELVNRTLGLRRDLQNAFELEQVVDAFRYDTGRDLTGYEDGTENPAGDDALAAAFVQDEQLAPRDSSFVAVQQWVHDLYRFNDWDREHQDHTIGRRRSDNEELADAPESAHVKRTTQERFEPEAFVLRRSMPWADASSAGLMFVAFGNGLYPFEAQLQRMNGADDGIVDALYDFSRPVTGAYFWCPPVVSGTVDLNLP